MSDNTPVTRYELGLELRPMKEDIKEVKEILKEDRASRWLGPRGHEFLTGGTLLLVLVTILVAIFFH